MGMMEFFRLGSYYDRIFPQFMELRSRAIEILQQQAELSELVQLVGRGSLSETDKVLMDVARILADDFLQQNGYSTYDRFCPFYKTHGMLRNILGFNDLARKLVTRSDEPLTWDVVKIKLRELSCRLAIMKFLCPTTDGEKVVRKELDELYDDIQRRDVEELL